MATRSAYRAEGKPKGFRNIPGPIGFEAQLCKTTYAHRKNVDASVYKQVVLRLLFLECIFAAFEARQEALEGEREQGTDLEDPDDYGSRVHLPHTQRTSGSDVDEAMAAIEHDNPSLEGVLPKDYARP